VLRVSDLPQPDNPFGGASNHTYTSSSHNIKVAIPQAAQSRLHDFEDDNTRDHFILEQQDINVEQPDQFGGPNTEWDLPQDPLQMIAQ
ncbi:hypothetical protein, partial [Enterococcus faecium]|uniref:hypothetical protein n=1 Tax=Enterococcus faecium TaxID=1352 RepID=UPI00113F6218